MEQGGRGGVNGGRSTKIILTPKSEDFGPVGVNSDIALLEGVGSGSFASVRHPRTGAPAPSIGGRTLN